MLNLEPWGKSHGSPLFLICSSSLVLSNYHIKSSADQLVQLLLGSGVWKDCQSFPTCTLYQQVDPHDGRKTTTPSLHVDSPLFHLLHDYMEHHPTLPSLLISRRGVLFPHAPFGLLYWWFLTQRGSECQFGHQRSRLWNMYFHYGLWSMCMSFLRHKLRVFLLHPLLTKQVLVVSL